jgi:photosystem II stability/assembly factor-like uncharacterized protein
VHKRFFVVTGLTMAAVLIAGGIIMLFASSLSGTGVLNRFTVRIKDTGAPVFGAGISLSATESGNLIQDASFEPLVFRQSLTIYSGDATTLTVSSEEAGQGLYGDGFFDQASARVMTRGESGLVLKKAARVVHYGINRVGVFQPVILPGDMPAGVAFLDFVRQGDLSVGVGEQGLIVRNLAGQAPEVVESGLSSDLTGICASGEILAACSADGDLLLSADGRQWRLSDPGEKKSLRAIAISSQSVVVAVGDAGSIVVGHDGEAMAIRPVTQADLTDIAYGHETFVAIGTRGTILTSKNGLIWRKVELAQSDDWQAIDYRDGRFVVVGRSGSVLTSDDGVTYHLLQQLPDTNCVDVVMLSHQQIIILDDNGEFLVSNDNGQNWRQSGIRTGMHSRVIALAGKDKVLSADDAGQLGLAQLVAEIQLDSPLKDSQYLSGDIIFLEKTSLTVLEDGLAAGNDPDDSQSPWTLYGQGQMERTDKDTAPNGGLSSLYLQTGQTGGPVIVSQQIDSAMLAGFSHNEVLQVTLWMRQQDISNRSVQVWLSGPFQAVGTTLTNVGTGWKKYTYAFVVPARPGGYAGQEIRFNIAIDSGSVWIDRVFLGRLEESPELLASSLQSQVKAISPQIIRLDFLGIGSQTILQENWARPMNNDSPMSVGGSWINQRGVSMHAALELAQSCDANPWLVIDSYAGEGEILNLIEFLAAPISEPYGKLRQEHGMVFPWIQQFQRVYVEICDRQQVFSTDRLRSDYVNLIIQTISQSPYYRQIKGQLVFVDGMSYQDGVMLSKADYHASDLNGFIRENRVDTSELTTQVFLDQVPRNPDKPAADFPELIRAATLRDTALRPMRLSDLVDLALFDLGRQSGLVNLASTHNGSGRLDLIWQAAARITAQAVRGNLLDIRQMTGDATGGDVQTEQGPRAEVRVYGFFDGTRLSIVLTNLSEETATCQLISELNLRQASMDKYDDMGNLLSSQVLYRSTGKITLLPGGVVILTKNFPEGQP